MRISRSFVIGVVVVLLVILFITKLFDSEKVVAPEDIIQRNQSAQEVNATTSVENLKGISSSSDVENDLDLYLESTDTLPNPNDFNDSYEDLNQ